MDNLWGANNIWMRTIYPPCDTDFYTKNIDVNGGIVPPLLQDKGDASANTSADKSATSVSSAGKAKSKRENSVVSFAQFRPEKDHKLQLQVWAKILEDDKVPKDAKLTMIGTVRGADDEKIVDELKSKARDLGIQDRVRFELNQPRPNIVEIFSKAKVAMHTMKDEHFGIAVVEMMASGIITVAHDSAGPKKDIIGVSKAKIGYLAKDADQYAFMVKYGLLNSEKEDMMKLKETARAYVSQKFGTDAFERKFRSQITSMF